MNFLPVNQPNDPPQTGAQAARSDPTPIAVEYDHSKLTRTLEWISARLNFYRIHLLHFILTPLISAAIFYASNGENYHSYVDSLYMVSPFERAKNSASIPGTD